MPTQRLPTSSIWRRPTRLAASEITSFSTAASAQGSWLIFFLELNGYRFTATEDAATQAVLGLAAGTLDEAEYPVSLRAHTTAGEC